MNVYKDQYETKSKLENMYTMDFLTQIYNRNILNYYIERDSQKLVTSLGSKINILIVDIDFFKVINDTYGHEAGDIVLKEVVLVLKNSIRKEDILLRWGGEEFVIVMPNSSSMDSKSVAERIRSNVESYESKVKPVTVSIGISEYKDDFPSSLDNADHALYNSKHSGRNKSTSYEELRRELDDICKSGSI
jgi:diguanylate cyclase (GGDEF)-like protein